MTNKHTPGPWQAVNQGWNVIDSEGFAVAEVDPNGNELANAQLIAAAPDLLEALKQTTDVLETLRRGYGVQVATACYPALNVARDALDKARGEK